MPGRAFLRAFLFAAGFFGACTSVALAQDASHGNAFEACAACHPVDKTDGLGPPLQGVIGRPAGTVPGFRYSRAMRNAKIVWDEKTLDAFLAEPQKVIPGNVMPFAGIADEKQRAEIIEQLRRLK